MTLPIMKALGSGASQVMSSVPRKGRWSERSLLLEDNPLVAELLGAELGPWELLWSSVSLFHYGPQHPALEPPMCLLPSSGS